MKKLLLKYYHMLASPPHFYRISGKLLPWLTVITVGLFAYGLYGGLVTAPVDYQQGDSYRVIFIHVPAAWMSMFIYGVMAVCGGIVLVWRMKLAEVMLISSAHVGAGITFLALVTGSIWGKPMWGTWWVWDARLTSELLLLFLYFGVIALYSSIEDKRTAAKAVSILALVGVVNLPIIHYSVEWWNTLHQGTTVSMTKGAKMPASMLIPLLVMATAFKFHYAMALLMRARNELIEREANSKWVTELVEES
jgi:heme exporter protein C